MKTVILRKIFKYFFIIYIVISIIGYFNNLYSTGYWYCPTPATGLFEIFVNLVVFFCDGLHQIMMWLSF